MEYYQLYEKRKVSLQLQWMELEGLLLNEISQKEKDKDWTMSFLHRTERGNPGEQSEGK